MNIRKPVRHVESGIEFPSIASAAAYFKLDKYQLRDMVSGKRPFKPGYTFEELPLDFTRLRIIIDPNQPEEFKPIPGYEKLYAISNKGNIISLKFNGRPKKYSTNTSGQHVIVLSDGPTPKMYTVEALYLATWQNIEPRGSYFKKNRSKKVMCIDDSRIFNSYKECCQYYRIEYQKFRKALHESDTDRFVFQNSTVTKNFLKLS